MTRTYALMEVSRDAFTEIKGKLEDAKYFHSIHDGGSTLDMHGIALQAGESVSCEREEETLP